MKKGIRLITFVCLVMLSSELSKSPAKACFSPACCVCHINGTCGYPCQACTDCSCNNCPTKTLPFSIQEGITPSFSTGTLFVCEGQIPIEKKEHWIQSNKLVGISWACPPVPPTMKSSTTKPFNGERGVVYTLPAGTRVLCESGASPELIKATISAKGLPNAYYVCPPAGAAVGQNLPPQEKP